MKPRSWSKFLWGSAFTLVLWGTAVVAWRMPGVMGADSKTTVSKPTDSMPHSPDNRAKPNVPREIAVRGVVVRYAETLRKRLHMELVEEWAKHLLALETEDGRLLLLLPTHGAQFFYHDARMVARPVELTARVHELTPGLEILQVHTLKNGKRNEIYYWCDVCAIKSYQLQDCVCCQGPVEVREHPVGESFRIVNTPATSP